MSILLSLLCPFAALGNLFAVVGIFYSIFNDISTITKGLLILPVSIPALLLSIKVGNKIDELEREDNIEKRKENHEEKKNDDTLKEIRERNIYNEIIALIATIKKSDKELMQCELDKVNEIIKKYFKSEEEQKKALELFHWKLGTTKTDINTCCKKINESLYTNTNKRERKKEIIQDLLSVAYADEEFLNRESSVIYSIAKKLYIEKEEYSDIIMDFELRNKQKYNTESLFKYSILILFAEVLSADNKQWNSKLNYVKYAIHRYYKTDNEQKIALKKFLFIINNKDKYIPKANYDFLKANLNDVAKTELIMELLAVVYADGTMYNREKEIINKIVENLGIEHDDFVRIQEIFKKKQQQNHYKEKEHQSSNSNYSNSQGKEDYQKEESNSNNQRNHYQSKGLMSGKEAYDILGVDMSVSDAEVKKAYRAMAIKYHPDNAAKLGEEAIRQATETMKLINIAWEVVKEARRIK
ncbi:MAG: TerB family tellurite resistance protein [Paludibacteraceae bacterium]|nr:TerB family tellurite resistance protein [Paludibacteraceae bacterium]